jgi:hypothetical protein
LRVHATRTDNYTRRRAKLPVAASTPGRGFVAACRTDNLDAIARQLRASRWHGTRVKWDFSLESRRGF